MNSANTFRGITRRSMHVISSASAKSTPTKAAPRQHKSSHKGFAALAAQESPQLSSARDIEVLLSNIGAGCRVSRPTIESMMQGTSTPTKAEHQPCKLSGSEMIDLIAQIRSI